MRKSLEFLAATGTVFAALAVLILPVAEAHNSGHESRTAAQWEKLPAPERQSGVKCSTGPTTHHFHPDCRAGDRCRPDDGRP